MLQNVSTNKNCYNVLRLVKQIDTTLGKNDHEDNQSAVKIETMKQRKEEEKVAEKGDS